MFRQPEHRCVFVPIGLFDGGGVPVAGLALIPNGFRQPERLADFARMGQYAPQRFGVLIQPVAEVGQFKPRRNAGLQANGRWN